MPQAGLTAERLADQLAQLIQDRSRLYQMAVNAYALSRRDATRTVADICEACAR